MACRGIMRGNRITEERYQQHRKKLLKTRLKKVKSAIDNRRPKEHKHLKRNMKREQMMEGALRTEPLGGAGAEGTAAFS